VKQALKAAAANAIVTVLILPILASDAGRAAVLGKIERSKITTGTQHFEPARCAGWACVCGACVYKMDERWRSS